VSYNAGSKVRIAHDNGTQTRATIVGRVFGDWNTPDVLTYRDDCGRCKGSSLHRHKLNPETSRII
jgi:hypothetical protein